ncbi:Receptor-like serine/threonine-protein kinase [Psidium guajava]|nr:Receptor-like serine/threonine-protein kinase [Psidium guajava]
MIRAPPGHHHLPNSLNFGFQKIGTRDYLLAVWFDKIDEKTIIWFAYGGNLAAEGSKVQLPADGHLVLTYSNGDELWSPSLPGTGVASTAMHDMGNSILANQDHINSWETFSQPTDTILLTQTLHHGKTLSLLFIFKDAEHFPCFCCSYKVEGNNGKYTFTFSVGLLLNILSSRFTPFLVYKTSQSILFVKPESKRATMASLASISFLLLLFLLLLPYLAISQSNIATGKSLVAGDKESAPWLSPSGDFALGFSQLDNGDNFLVSIWYDKIPEKTIVWSASDKNTPVVAPQGSKLAVAPDRGLALNGPGDESLWSSDPIVGVVAYGYMNDTGNFVLRNSNSEILWESFKNPTDTILPGQIASNSGILLSSRLSASNFTQGRFQLHLQDGNLQLRTINLPSSHANEPYFRFPALSPPVPVTGISFNSTGFLNILHDNGQTSPLTTGSGISPRDNYLRATLEWDGVFIQYSRPKTGGNWTVVWREPENICKTGLPVGSGICGFNRICRLDVNYRPVCDCPRGFSVLNGEDEHRNCVPNYLQSCGEAQSSGPDEFALEDIANIDWPTSDYDLLQPFNEDECKDSCLHDCMCAVAIFRGGDMCWKKKLPLSNGRIDMNLNSKAFIKRRKDGSPPQNSSPPGSNGDKKDTLILAGSVLLGSSVFVNVILIAATGLGFVVIYQNKLKQFFKDESGMHINIRSFTYKELEEATDDFKEELGRGSFGIVYKGAVESGDSKIDVAVKKLDRSFQESDKEFKTEVIVIGQTHHKNLVRLIGYCNEGQNRLLVYELLSNGTLASFLFEDLKPSWEQRTQIALEIGKGLLYLHEECSTQIIHCDIKPQNILLDEYYSARISDFGLAKLLINQTQAHTAIRGTRGYVAPEWFRNMPITMKVDVYSFGILLLEIICCRRSIDIEAGDEESVILAEWAFDCYREGMLGALVGKDEAARNDMKKLERFVMVAIWCIQEDPASRPSMKKVMLMLEGIIQVPAPPSPFAFSTISTV